MDEKIDGQEGKDRGGQLAVEVPKVVAEYRIAGRTTKERKERIGEQHQVQAIGPGAEGPEGGQAPGDRQVE